VKTQKIIIISRFARSNCIRVRFPIPLSPARQHTCTHFLFRPSESKVEGRCLTGCTYVKVLLTDLRWNTECRMLRHDTFLGISIVHCFLKGMSLPALSTTSPRYCYSSFSFCNAWWSAVLGNECIFTVQCKNILEEYFTYKVYPTRSVTAVIILNEEWEMADHTYPWLTRVGLILAAKGITICISALFCYINDFLI
jgi:hypothetical protein